MIQKLYLCVIITFDVIIFITLADNYLQTKKQLINLLFKDVKNLTSILNCYIGPNCVPKNALSLYDIHFSLIL